MGWGGGRLCRGAGFGGHGRRNVYDATGLTGWMRSGRWSERWSEDRPDIEDERRDLEWRASQLDAELGRIRARLDELQGERARDS
jgi:hypothetical protein